MVMVMTVVERFEWISQINHASIDRDAVRQASKQSILKQSIVSSLSLEQQQVHRL